MKPARILLIYSLGRNEQTTRYHIAWVRYFKSHPRFTCHGVNLQNKSLAAKAFHRLKIRARSFDAIVILHSACANSVELEGKILDIVGRSPRPKAVFLGNEYKLMPEKMRLCEQIGVSLFISQSNSPTVLRLYEERLRCRVTSIPGAGADNELFVPRSSRSARPIDIGYRAYVLPPYGGHREREEIADCFLAQAPKLGLLVDISVRPEDRYSEKEWANFLNRCKAQLGTEAGVDYFELTDQTRNDVNRYMHEHPLATQHEIFERFFRNYPNPIPCRTISGRHVEAAGTKTVQILFEGYYNGYLKPDEHYIPLKKDFSNVDEAIAKFRDEAYCGRITENACHLVRQELTYEKLIDKFHHALRQVL